MFSRRFGVCVAVLFLLATIGIRQATAMGMEEFGPARERVVRQHGWPNGMAEVLGHPSRVYWQWVNGSERAYYDGDVQTVNALLELYSRVELDDHPVVLLAGKGAAQSFHGKSTPYSVEFDVPGRMEISARKLEASAELYPLMPRMIVCVDEKLAEQLDKLNVPKNVTLHATAVRLETARALADDPDTRTRWRAIVALGGAGDTSAASLEAVKRAAADTDSSIRAAGERALEKLSTAKDPNVAKLRLRLADFIRGHSQRGHVPNP